jgi:hypothetical protein
MFDFVSSVLAKGLVVGVHLASMHSEPTYPCDVDVTGRCHYNNTNPGLYVRFSSGFTAGVYDNSYHDVSAYAGWTWQTADERFAVTAGGAVGYRRMPVMPVIIPSMRIPLDDHWSARLSVVPKPSIPLRLAVAHLSIERKW